MGVSGKLHYGGENLLDANMDIDLFARRVQKISVMAKVKRQNINNGRNITSVIEVNSQGQQLKVDLKSHVVYTNMEIGFGSILSYTDQHKKPKRVGVLFALDPRKAHLYVMSPNKEIIRADAKMQLQKNLQKLDAEVAILNNQPIVINMEVNDLNNFKYQEYAKGTLHLDTVSISVPLEYNFHIDSNLRSRLSALGYLLCGIRKSQRAIRRLRLRLIIYLSDTL